MIMGSCTAPFYYGFMCDESWYYGKLYLGQVYFFCITALYVTLRTSGGENVNATVNAIAYLVAGYSTSPGIYHMSNHLDEEQAHRPPTWPFLGGGILYAIGAITYALKVPERFIERKFDIIGSSH